MKHKPTTSEPRLERQKVVGDLITHWQRCSNIYVTTLAKEIDEYYHPRTLRPVQTALGEVTYHEGEDFPWRCAQGKDVQGANNLTSLSSIVRGMLTRLTDDEIERCLPLRKQPWEE